MLGFNEVVLEVEVDRGLGQLYKEAIEKDHERYWTENKVRNAAGEIIIDEVKPVWSGNYVHVDLRKSGMKDRLTINLVSRTVRNLKETRDEYVAQGARVIKETIREMK